MSRYPPSVVLEDLSSLEDVSTCSSTSTLTCSVWSSMSNLDRSSIRQISSLTFSGMLDDDEYFSSGEGEEQDHNNHASAAKVLSYSVYHHEAKRSATTKNSDQSLARTGKTTADPLMLSERSLFQERLSPIRRNEAPRAPARPQDDGSKKKEDGLTPVRPLFTKSSSFPTRFDNTICTTPTNGRTGLKAMKSCSFTFHGVDLKPQIPTRSSHDWNDDSTSGPSLDDHSGGHNASLVEEKIPRARRKQLMKRIDHIQRMLENDGDDDCKVLRGGVSTLICRLHEEPPKLPRRGLFIDAPARDRPSALSPTRNPCHSVVHKKHDITNDECESENEVSKNHSFDKTFDKKSRMLANKLPPTQPRRRKKRTTKTPDHHAHVYNTSKKQYQEEETPPLLLAKKVSKSERDLLPRRPRSKTPPKRFATAPAILLRFYSDGEKYPIPKRIVKRNRSSEHRRRRGGQILSNSSLARILESDDENFVPFSPSNSPQQRAPTRRPVTPASCPSRRMAIKMDAWNDAMSRKDSEIVRTASGSNIVGDEFLKRPAREHTSSWLGSGTRSLLL